MSDLKNIALDLLEKYKSSEETVIGEFSGCIEKELKELEAQCKLYRLTIEQAEAASRENVRGEWLPKEEKHLWECSVCENIIYSEHEWDRREYHAFCGRCGAEMRGEK